LKRRTGFHAQPERRFVRTLVREFRDERWHLAEIAVAWVRRSGAQALFPALRAFLARGGLLRIIVGIDLENTSREGLRQLLKLEKYGDVGVSVHHNEAQYVTFHPKIYLFRNGNDAKAIVGSNNLTAGGLALNTEAALTLEGSNSSKTIIRIADTLAQWRDPSSVFVRPLTQELLEELVQEGYVLPEAKLQKRRQTLRTVVRRKRSRQLFGRQAVPGLHRIKRRKAATPATPEIARVLLMRVRKAHATDRPTQTQLPKEVYEDGFFSGIDATTSLHDGRSHTVRKAWARGIVNTLKLEIPEMRRFADPVLKLLRTSGAEVRYEVHDRHTQAGSHIFADLEAGRTSVPRKTQLTRPSNPGQSTWWRFLDPTEF